MDEALWFSADWDFWLKLTRSGDTVYCPTPLALFRLHGASQTIARARRTDEVHRQQTLVQSRHLAGLKDASLAADVRRVGRFSTEVNVALLRLFDGQPTGAPGLAAHFLALGPTGWLRYFRDSRIVERCLSRVQAGALGWRAHGRASRESLRGMAPSLIPVRGRRNPELWKEASSMRPVGGDLGIAYALPQPPADV